MSTAAAPPDPSSGPSGSEPSTRRGGTVAWTASTYFGEGLPWSILHQVAAEFFTAAGLPAREVGFTSALHFTSSLKFVWSPIVDLIGTLRQWIVATQFGLGVLMAVLAVFAHNMASGTGSGTAAIWVVLIVIGLFSATHDIACDGYYMTALGRADQARYTGIRVAAFRVAMLVGSSGLVFLGGRVHWLAGFGVGAVLMVGLAVAHRVWLPQIGAVRPVSASSGDKAADWRARLAHVRGAYFSFLLQPRALVVLLFLLSFKLGDALMFGMSKVLFRELGISTPDRGVLNGFGTAASIAGAMLGGLWVARVGLRRALLPIALIMAGTLPLYLLLAAPRLPADVMLGFGAPLSLAHTLSPPLWHVGTILVIEQLCGGLATAAQTIFIMSRCHPDHKAAHFAFATAIYSLAQTISGTYSGFLYEAHGPIVYFSIAAVACIPCLVLIPFLRQDR
ncbi:MFS transporter [Nannocystis bainbridge]|uniref:MFS transporter n=1 Tax=Nannocystis bainbridge TaxID=2995303 RepID=A0ABT5DXN0_9BACT|nr:MFS transporter [Nannocystis bainbridge]MDC0718326.1 MFS transporter [Nannocystis bainbridge]